MIRRSLYLLKMTALAVFVLLPAACQQDMATQPSYKPLDPSEFFVDGRSARYPPPGTVARGHLRLDAPLFFGRQHGGGRVWAEPVGMLATGAQAGGLGAIVQRELQLARLQNDYVKEIPIPVTEEVVRHGRDRFMIYCVVCHGALGYGRDTVVLDGQAYPGGGPIVQRGYTPPPSFHIQRLRDAPVGHFFDVITNGYGSMPMYQQQIPPRDRWAIVAYIRALQLSQHFPQSQLQGQMKQQYDAAIEEQKREAAKEREERNQRFREPAPTSPAAPTGEPKP